MNKLNKGIICMVMAMAMTMHMDMVLVDATEPAQESPFVLEEDVQDDRGSVGVNQVPEYPFTREDIDVTQYSYEVYPILSPFCYYVYVKTDNPDPTSFCLYDKDTRYSSQEGYTEAVWSIFDWRDGINLYSDVQYEDASSYRVNGGYIFTAPSAYPDGGELIVQQRAKDTYVHYYYINWETNYVDTDLVIQCPEVKTYTDVLIEEYIDPSKTLFENLDAVQSALDDLAVYPRAVRDSDKPNEERPYPFYTTSPYKELGLNEWYSEMFEDDRILLSAVYPYVLDSLGFPGTIASIAERLEPDCEVARGSVHWLIDVTYQGETRSYGGAGRGDSDSVIYTKRVNKDYKFDNSKTDYFANGTVELYYDKIIDYARVASQDLAEYKEMLTGKPFVDAIRATGGTWIRVGKEGFLSPKNVDFAYEIPYGEDSCTYLSNAWVDGRYISEWEGYLAGALFSEYPNANIVVTKMNYTDVNGVEHTQDVLFNYDESNDTWRANYWYYFGDRYYYYYDDPLPDEFVLTRTDVEAMQVDRNTSKFPESGLVYDGAVPLGSPFSNYTMTYKPSADSDDYRVQAVEVGKSVALPSGVFSAPEGMQFKAWQIDGKEYKAEAEYTPTKDTTAIAVWEPIRDYYEITFQANNGTNEEKIVQVKKTETLVLPKNEFSVPENMQFKAWEINGEEYMPGEGYYPHDDTVVKALWEPVPEKVYFKLTYLPNTELDEPVNVTVEEGQSVKLPDNMFKVPEGKAFKAWQIGGKEYQPGDAYTPKADTTVKALWKDAETACTVFGFCTYNGKKYWYENSTRQGVYGDPKNIWDTGYGGLERGREIYDPASDGWYWLDAVYDGAAAYGKEVWMPYIYQDEDNWSDAEIRENANRADEGMKEYVYQCMKNKEGKWVRYDNEGKMRKGWVKIEGKLAEIYPDQAGNTYYYDTFTGLMAKGWLTIDGKLCHFDELTGVLQ